MWCEQMMLIFTCQKESVATVLGSGALKRLMLCDSECDSLQKTMICKLVFGHVMRPFFLNKPTTNKTKYLQMLKDHVVTQFPNLSQVILQQDSAPQHWGQKVHGYCNVKFPSLCIGSRGPISRPLCSPDITSWDFLFWGTNLKDTVCQWKAITVEELQQKVNNIFLVIISLFCPKIMCICRSGLISVSDITHWAVSWTVDILCFAVINNNNNNNKLPGVLYHMQETV
jgi:hypothetical protein